MAALHLLMTIVAVIIMGEITRQTEGFFLANLQHAAEQPLESIDKGDMEALEISIDDLETSDHTEASETEITNFNIFDTEEPEVTENVGTGMTMEEFETPNYTKASDMNIKDAESTRLKIEHKETSDNAKTTGMENLDFNISDIKDAETKGNIIPLADTEDAEIITTVTQPADIENTEAIQNVAQLPDIGDAVANEDVAPGMAMEYLETSDDTLSLVDQSILDLKEEDDGTFVHNEVHSNGTITPLADIEDTETIPQLADSSSLVDRSILELKEGDTGNLLDNEVPSNRTKRDALECGLSPEGVAKPCLVCDGSRHVFFTDINGHTCWCEVCRIPKYMEVPCLCTPNGEVESGPQCSFPTLGEEYMNVSNFCDRPKKCSKCKGDMEVRLSCTLTSDTKCGCPKDTYQSGHNKCDPIPPCRKNFEIHEIGQADSVYNTYECRPCEDGFIQPNDNSLDRCRPIEEKDTTEVPPDGVTIQKEQFNCPPDYCPPSCFASEPQNISQPEADAVESGPIGCNDTVYDGIDDDYANEQYRYILPSTFIEHPLLWLGLGTVIIVVYLSSVMIALVYGSKNKKKVRRLTEVLRINKWLYRKPDPEFPRSEDPGENPHPLRINPQNTQNPQYYNYQNTNAHETQLLTSEQEGTLINDDTGDQRRKSNRVLLRERSRTDSTNVE